MDKIPLDKKYSIQFDTHAIMLVKEEEYEKKDKKTQIPTGEFDTREVKTWHPNLKQALQEYINQLGFDELNLQQVIDRISVMEESINKFEKLYHKKLVA